MKRVRTTVEDPDEDPEPEPSKRRSLAERINRADHGREVPAGTEGSHVRQPDWTRGEHWDGEDAFSGAIDPSRGEIYFLPDNDRSRARSDRTYRGGKWKPPADAMAGKVVDMPYKTS